MSLTFENMDVQAKIDNIKCFALDMDGTVYLGRQWIDGAKDFLHKVEESGRQYCFLTNNSSKNAVSYVEKLDSMGLKVDPKQIITSGHATVSYLKKHFAGKKVYLLGNELLCDEFTELGIELVQENPDVVVTAFDTSLDYKKMCVVCDFVREGRPYLSTHPDYNCPTETGFIPDSGAIHAFIHASANRWPDVIVGKPNGAIIDFMLERVGATAEHTAMVGDRLYTDIAAGVNNGLTGIMVLSGEATLADLQESDVKPHLVFDSVKSIIQYL